MRRHPVVNTALLCALLAVVPLSAAEATRTLRVELSPAAGAFAVENLAGTMRVVPGSGSSVVAVATVHAESGDLADAMRFEQVAGRQGLPTLRVRYPLDRVDIIRYPGAGEGGDSWLGRLFAGGRNSTKYDDERVKVRSGGGTLLYADVEVQVPRGAVEATFINHIGLLRGADVEGTLRFDTASGDIRLERLRGEVVADTGSGDVRIVDAGGSVRCDTGSGDCDITGFDGEKLTCDVGSGDVVIRSISARRIDVDTGSGDVQAVDVEVEEFSADTGSGDVSLQADGNRLARVVADTGSGDVTLRLGPDASFEALVDQGSGDLVNNYSDARPITKRRTIIGFSRGDGRTQIKVSTGSGDLILEPGGATARAR